MSSLERPALSVAIPTFNNLATLRRCLEGWQRHAGDQPVELVVVDDGCRDGTTEFLARAARTEWGRRALTVVRLDDAHELRCTNAGFAAARGELLAAWQDDMLPRAGWMVPELVRTFRRYPELGMLALSRGITLHHVDGLPETWAELVSWRRLRSGIGPAPWNWFRLQEVDGVIRPWVVRRACIDAVGALDEVYRPTEWDETDLAFRIRRAGWKVAATGYERLGAYVHLGSTTIGRTPSEKHQAFVLRNGRVFLERWGGEVREGQDRPRRHWARRATPAGWAATFRQMARFAANRALRRGGER